MASERGGSTGGVVVYGSHYEKPKNIIDAISELEQYSAVIKEEEVPESFFTFKQKWEFFEVGFRDSFISGLTTAMFTPIAMGVVQKLIPIFGDNPPTTFDRVFAFMLALGFSIGYSLLIAVILGKHYYSNKITRTAMNNFLTGLFTGAIFKGIIAFLGFHFLYFFIFTPHHLKKWTYELFGRLNVNEVTCYKIYAWLVEFREVLIPSAYFVALTTIIFIVIPLVSIFYHKKKQKQDKDVNELLNEL